MSAPRFDRQAGLGLIQRRAFVAGLLGLTAFSLLGALLYFTGSIHSLRQLWLSYLVAYTFCLGIAVGCLVILMLQYLTGGAWGALLRRMLESASQTLPLLALLFIPILLAPQMLYTWAQPGGTTNPTLSAKAGYLNVPFFMARAVLFFLIWLSLSFVLKRWSVDPAYQTDERLKRRFRLLSGPGLVLYGLSITFASIDWVMSLEPTWYSTIFPVLYATSQVLTGFAFAVAALMCMSRWPAVAPHITPTMLRNLGSLLLTFVMLWAYMAFSQFLLMWAGDLPEEVPWYLRRTRSGWQVLALLLIILHFAIPFLLLLSRTVKEDPRGLGTVAAGLLVMRFFDVFWWIEPAYSHEGEGAFWLLDLTALVAVGGLWLSWFCWQLSQSPVVAVGALFAETSDA